MQIKNFILIFYTKNKLDLPTDSEAEKTYLSSHKPALTFMIEQIKSLYPESKINLMTNTDLSPEGCVIHKMNIASNHTAKLEIYSLLDEPAMYLDCDIIMQRRFNEKELSCEGNFKLYSLSKQIDLSGFASQPIESKKYNVYNAGVVWIPKPSKEITLELQTIEKDIFGDKKKITDAGEWPYNDEYALGYYLEKRNQEFEKSKTVNVLNWWSTQQDVQSTHYTGLKGKRAFLRKIKTPLL